jgi:glycosyltransferase involved in cell wall biosynthesis
MSVRISAVVCTYNRASYLSKALKSLACQTLDPVLYEVIVVDNASTDNTREVFNEYIDKPNWRYLFQSVPGLSRARNTAWKNAKGDYIFFMDDDAIAAPDCLEEYIEAFDTFKLQTGCIGGKVELIWEAPRPNWLHNGFLGILSEYHYSDSPLILSEEQWLSACNLAIPKCVLQSIGGMREDLGRKGDTLLAGEETYFRKKIDAKGLYSIYYPQALVKHHVTPSRLTKQWFRKHAYWMGRSIAIMLREDGELPPLKCRVSLSTKRIVWSLPRLILMLISFKQSDRFRRQHQIIESIGYITALWNK